MLAFILLLFIICLVLRRRYRIPRRLLPEQQQPEELLVPRLTEQELANLKSFVKRGGIGSCPICIMDFEVCFTQDREQRVVLPDCFHEYHLACLTDWLNINPVCP